MHLPATLCAAIRVGAGL